MEAAPEVNEDKAGVGRCTIDETFWDDQGQDDEEPGRKDFLWTVSEISGVCYCSCGETAMVVPGAVPIYRAEIRKSNYA